MSLAKLVPLLFMISNALTVFCLGLDASIHDATYLFRRPQTLLRSLASMNIVMPLFAIALVAAFHFRPALEIALVALAISPIPPLLPRRIFKTGGSASYTIGLLVTSSILAVVFVPLTMWVLSILVALPGRMLPDAALRLVVVTVFIPIVAGIGLHTLASRAAERIARPLSLFAIGLLVAGFVPILFTTWRAAISLIGNGTILAIVVFIIAGTLIGEVLGGANPADRIVLALATASRHPGVAIALASASFPNQKQVPAAVLLYLITNAVVSIPYTVWSRRRAHPDM